MQASRPVAGSIAGLAATVPMTAVMAAINRIPPAEPLPLPPKRITYELATRTPPLRGLDDRGQEVLAWTSHGLYGAAAGAIYGLIAPRREKGKDVLAGALYGLAIWAASYPGWLPRAGVREDPGANSRRRIAEQVASHLVWGVTTALLTRWLLEERRSEEDTAPAASGGSSRGDARRASETRRG